MELDRKSYELSTLFEVAKNFLEIKDINTLKQQIVFSALGILGAKGGVLLEFDSKRNILTVAVSLGLKSKVSPDTKFSFRKKWEDFLVTKKQGVPLDFSDAARNSSLEIFARSNLHLMRTIEPNALIPICDDEKLWGLLCLQEKLLDKGYSTDDFNLMTSLASLAAKAWRSLATIKPRERAEPVIAGEFALPKIPSQKIKKELSSLRKEYPVLKEIVGESRAVLSLFSSILEVAKTKCPVLILGQTGTGKELVANAIHQLSSRREYPFVELNCASVPGELIESELFGYERGAFTGAVAEKKGIFQQAHNGTLFLDEIGDMGLHLQTKLLRVIQEGRFRRLGGEKSIEVDVRIIAASNKDLVRETRKRNFREDLLYRINVYPIYLPTLEQKPEDIPLLAQYFLTRTVREFGLQRKLFSPGALKFLTGYRYPGNIRELNNIVERVALRSGEQEVIESYWLAQELKRGKREGLDLSREPFEAETLEESSMTSQRRKPQLIFEAELEPEGAESEESETGTTLAEIERSHILRILRKTKSNKTKAARILGIPRSTLIGKMKKLRMM